MVLQNNSVFPVQANKKKELAKLLHISIQRYNNNNNNNNNNNKTLFRDVND